MKRKSSFIVLSLFLVCLIFAVSFQSFAGNIYAFNINFAQTNEVDDFLEFEKAFMDLNNSEVNSVQSISTLEEDNFNNNEESDKGKFCLKRLIVEGELSNSYGAVSKLSYNNLLTIYYILSTKFNSTTTCLHQLHQFFIVFYIVTTNQIDCL